MAVEINVQISQRCSWIIVHTKIIRQATILIVGHFHEGHLIILLSSRVVRENKNIHTYIYIMQNVYIAIHLQIRGTFLSVKQNLLKNGAYIAGDSLLLQIDI